MAGEIPMSQVYEDWRQAALETGEAFITASLFGEKDMESPLDEDTTERLNEVAQTLALDCLINTINNLGAHGLHFWLPIFAPIFTLSLQFYLRGYALGLADNPEAVEEYREIIDERFEIQRDLIEEQGLKLIVEDERYAEEFQREDIDNPFGQEG